MSEEVYKQLVSLETEHPIWDRFFAVAPLVVIGTREAHGGYDLAPKHMAAPLGWENYFGFVCTPAHGTYRNVRRDGAFTVSFPRPEQVVLTSLSASPRCDDGSKQQLAALPTMPARLVDGVFLQDAYLLLECELDRIVDGFGSCSLIAGRVLAAHVHREALRRADRDDQEALLRSPLLAYLHPGRFATISDSNSFPFPAGFRR